MFLDVTAVLGVTLTSVDFIARRLCGLCILHSRDWLNRVGEWVVHGQVVGRGL